MYEQNDIRSYEIKKEKKKNRKKKLGIIIYIIIKMWWETEMLVQLLKVGWNINFGF